ncbi:BTAD domain-containing putative transcriptional regulator [Streptomyces sp. TRM49041]|uniref:AfsR/SARP family transcriptional regulator n=1 Tax=Streptomyces sp. TRM49041 TaxID=2603216 RepID=UPI0011F03E07|nr:BTAD domain-containing putative transcriptional regulator [Streptomyces sp. TRM49041]
MTHRYRVLGATRALRPDGTEAPVGGPRLRALLTALAAAAGRAVPAGELAAQIWADTPPADEPAALQALVGRLRRALGREAVDLARGGYRLRLAGGPDDIDLFRFERLAAEGATALAADDPAAAAHLLDRALALWQGPALADLPGRDDDPLAVRAERLRTGARRDRLAAEVALGRPEQALTGLAELAAAHPLDEPLAALHIRALRAAGRHAEALHTYEQTRTHLSHHLGTDPSPQLRALHTELLAPAPTTPPPSPKAHSPTAPPAHAGQPGPGVPQAQGNLRARLTSFVGRGAELAALAGDLGERRLVTLLGPGGVGKTRLALEAADAVAAAWTDGVWVAELAPVRDGADVPETVLTALGAREAIRWSADTGQAGGRDPLAELVERCARRRVLLVLDNCEHVVSAAAHLAQHLLERCPGLTVLATSREPLTVPGETLRPVEPLPAEAALRLLGERGAAARAGFEVRDDPDACVEICRRLDGLPLAIELAAARLRALDPRRIADRLDDRFRLLTGGSRTALPRQQTLRAVVDWSWDLLDHHERAVLRRLSVFSGGCAPAQAETVCAAPGNPGPAADTLDHLTSLIDKSLVVAAPAPDGTMRYRLLETVAEYASERLDEAGERDTTELRHLAAYRELARTGDRELRGPRQAAWLRVFEAEHDNVRAALRTAVDRGEEQEGMCLVMSMSWYWQLRGHQPDAGFWSAAVAALGPDPFLPPVRPAVPLTEPCTATPPPWPEDQLWEARRSVRLLVLAADGDLGAAALERPEMRAYLRAVVDAYRPGHPQNSRQPGAMWFFVRLMTGDLPSLRATMDSCLDCCRTHGDAGDIGFALLMRAKMLPGDPADAEEALARFEEAGNPWGIAQSLSARGEAYERAGRYAEAARDFQGAMDGARRIGDPTQVTVFRARLAAVRLHTATGPAERARAERMLEAASDEAAEHNTEVISTARLLLAQHYGLTGRVPQARAHVDMIGRELRPGTAEMFTGMVTGLRAWLDCVEGNHARALERVAEAVRSLETLAHLVAPPLLLGQFATAALALARLGDPHTAARLVGAYDRHGDTHGGTGLRQLTPEAERDVRDEAEAVARAALAPAGYAAAYAEGAALTLKEAAALVRRPRPRAPAPGASDGAR